MCVLFSRQVESANKQPAAAGHYCTYRDVDQFAQHLVGNVEEKKQINSDKEEAMEVTGSCVSIL